MSDIWVISDTHFNHANFLNFMDANGEKIRRFDNVGQMNECICDGWAETVNPGDIIYHLGDVYFGGHAEAAAIIKKLPGRKRLIVGNHDDIINIVKQNMFQKITAWRIFREYGVVLSHIPLNECSLSLQNAGGIKNIHGHIHQNDSPVGNYVNVCVEKTNYRPVLLSDLRMKL